MIFELGSPCADPPFPQAAEASEPIEKRSESSLDRRSLSIDRITMSISSPPSCTPTLPLSKATAPGADHLPPFRHEMNPRPWPTPTTTAPFLNPGTTTTQSALASCSARSSCPDVILLRTAVAFPSRAVVSSAPAAVATATIVNNRRFCVVRTSLVLSCGLNADGVPTGPIREKWCTVSLCLALPVRERCDADQMSTRRMVNRHCGADTAGASFGH